MRLKRAKEPGNQPRRQTIDLFPAFRYSNAFDICVSAAGYNAFHENLLGAIPTIFVPNEAEEMDLQLVRAKYAEVLGLALQLRRDHDRYRIGEVVETMLDDRARTGIRLRCQRLDRRNGAEDIASFVTMAAHMLRTDRLFS